MNSIVGTDLKNTPEKPLDKHPHDLGTLMENQRDSRKDSPVIDTLLGKKEILKRLHHITGQLAGIEKMIVEERHVKEVYTQLRAAESALHQAIYGVLDEHLKKHFAEVLATRLARCPGDCDDAEHLQFLRNEFSTLDLKELIDELSWLRNSLNTQTQGGTK